MKKTTRFLGVLMALSMMLAIMPINAFAAQAKYSAPTSPTTIDKTLITTAAHSQGWVLPEIIGITNTTATNQEVPEGFESGRAAISLEKAEATPAFGVLGSDINENPNPYLYNYFYNARAYEEGLTPAEFGTYTLSKDVGRNPSGAITTGGYDQNGQTVCASLYLRPDILLGVQPIDAGAGTTGYTAAIKELPENKDDNPNNDYNPYQVDYTSEHVYSFLQCMYEMSDIVTKIKAEDPKRTTRYEDPYVITSDVEKYVKGLQSYVYSRAKADNTDLRIAAVVDTSTTDIYRNSGAIAENEFVLNTKDISTVATTKYSRVAEFVADSTINLVDELNLPSKRGTVSAQGQTRETDYYIATADQIAGYADVVFFCNVLGAVFPNENGDGLTAAASAFIDDLTTGCTTAELRNRISEIEIMGSAFDCVGSLGANSVENLLGMAYYTAYLYPQYLNQFEVAAYWYQNFYHISDNTKLQETITANFSTASVQSDYSGKYTTDLSNYDPKALEAKIIEGMKYYEANESEFTDTLLYQNGRTGKNTGWDIDWTVGIGSDVSDELTVKKAADGNWYAYRGNQIASDYTGFASNENGTWYVVNGKVGFNVNSVLYDSRDGHKNWKYVRGSKFTPSYTGIASNENGWWRIVNGIVDFNATGVFNNENGWWYVKNGAVQFNYTGIKNNANGWWRIEKGQVNFNANGIFNNENGWWKVESGQVNFNFTGIASNANGKWYIKGGQVQFNYTGKVTYQGKTYNIKGGKVV